MANHVKVGNAGEHLVMAELLFRGCHAFMADRGNPAFDLTAILLDNRQLKIRVKTCGLNRTVQYNSKKSGQVFLELCDDDNTDFVAIVAPRKRQTFTSRSAECWIIPTQILNADLWATDKSYFATTNRNGSPRKRQKLPWFTLRLDGDPEGSPLNGWATRWANWYENWAFQTNTVQPVQGLPSEMPVISMVNHYQE
jgi:hypothetical protein